VAAATIVAALLRGFHLGRQSLWIDEVLTWSSAGIGRPLPWRDLLDNVHGPLYTLVIHLWGGLAGDSEWALRLPSALFGTALVPATAWLASRWLGRETAGPAGWLAAGSPFLVWYSQEARNYSLLLLAVTLSGVALLSLSREIRARGIAGYLAGAGLGLLSNFSFAFVLPLHLWWWLGETARRRRRLVACSIALAALALIALPWAPQVLRVWDWHRLHPGHAYQPWTTPLRGSTTFHPAAVPFAAYSFAVGFTLGPSLRELRSEASMRTLARHAPAIALVALVFAPLGVLGLAAARRRRRLGEALLWLLVPTLVVSYFALRNFKVFHPRYIAVAYPCFILLLAAAIADLGPRARRAAVMAIALLWAVSLHHHYFVPIYGREDCRAAAALVRERGVAGEKLLAVNTEEPMFYYYRGPLRHDRLWLGYAADPVRLERKLTEALAGASGAWVVLSRPEDLDPADTFARLLDRRFPDAGRYRLEGVRVWHIRGTGSSPGGGGS
jgi:4-amino-4-deoxy-L-arabinose transferase-like glycosyltransferase